MKQFLLTGGSGRLGTELQKYLDCIAPNKNTLDVSSEISVEKFKKSFNVDSISAVIHCAAFTNVPGAEIHKKEAIQTNIIGTRNIVNWFNAKIIYISSDYVYAGQKGNYKETDATNPFNFYGFTKLAGEAFLNPQYDLIIRTSFKPNGKWLFPAAFTDLYTSADYVDIIAKEIAFVIKCGTLGIINVGTKRKSIYDLAIQRNTDMGKISVKDIKNVNLPSDISMNLDKLNELKLKYGG